MNLPYPVCFPCVFTGFPPVIDLRCGNKIGEIVSSCGYGSKRMIYKTPNSGIAQGPYTVGSPIPECEVIYSDTGSDDSFSLKVSFSSFGYFYRKHPMSDLYIYDSEWNIIGTKPNHYFLKITKRIKVTGDTGVVRIFSKEVDGETYVDVDSVDVTEGIKSGPSLSFSEGEVSSLGRLVYDDGSSQVYKYGGAWFFYGNFSGGSVVLG